MSGKQGFFSDKRKPNAAATVATVLALLTLLAVPLLQRGHLATEHPGQCAADHRAAPPAQLGSTNFVPFPATRHATAAVAAGQRHDAHPCPLCQFFFTLSKACPLLFVFLAALALRAVQLGKWAEFAHLYPGQMRSWRSRAPPAAILYGLLFFGSRATARRAWGKLPMSVLAAFWPVAQRVRFNRINNHESQ